MTQDEAPRSVADALSEVERMREQALTQHKAQLTAFDEEVERLQASIDNLQAQLEAVKASRAQADAAFQERGGGSHAEAYHLIFAALRRQSSMLAERNMAWTEAQRARDAKLAEALAAEGLEQALQDYQAIERNPETLNALPASYRDAAVAAHEANGQRLRARLAELIVEPSVDAPDLSADVVLAVDGDPEGGVAMVVVPVPEEVHGAWESRDADLLTEIAGRVVQGLYTSIRGTSFEAAQAAFGGHQGLLALEIELPPGAADGFGERLQAALQQVCSDAESLAGAKVTLGFSRVEVDRLLPPEDESEDPDAEVEDAG